VKPVSGGASQRCALALPIERTLPSDSSSTRARWTVRWLASEGKGQRRGGPRRAVGEQRHECRLLAIDGRREDHDLAPHAGRDGEASIGRLDAGDIPDQRSKPTDLHPSRARWSRPGGGH
jgi:hypothetical protein